MHPGGGAGGGTARRLPALLSPQLGARRGRGAHGGGTGQRPHGGNDTPCTSLGVPGPPPAFPNPCSCWHRQLPAPCPAPSGSKHHRASPSPISPNPTPTPDHILRGTGMLPARLPAQKPQILPPTTSPQLPALGAPAARQLPHYYSAQSLPNNRRIVAGGSKKPRRGAASASPCARLPRGCAITDPKPSSPQQHRAGLGTTPGREQGWHHRHSSAPAPRALGEAPEGQEGWGWPRSPRTAPPGLPRGLAARPARSWCQGRCSPRSPRAIF